MTPRLALIAALLCLCHGTARAESEYERGYRDGYSRGFQDSRNGKSSAGGASRSPAGIVVIRARYGDDNRSCDLTSWAAGRFNGRTRGEVDVTNDICGDVAPGKRKSLEVDYYCRGEAKSESAYEHRKLSIQCY